MRNEEVKNRSEEEISKEALCENVQLEQVNGGMNSGNDPRSILEWFERHGVDGNFQNRERIFRDEMGCSNYRGTAQQDIQMLNYLKSTYGP